MDFSFPVCNVSIKVTIHGLIEYHTYQVGIAYNIISDQAMKFGNKHRSINKLNVNVHDYRETASLIKQYNRLMNSYLWL